MRVFKPACFFTLLILVTGVTNAQLIVEDFDSQTTGSPPAWLWWNNGSSGTIQVDETTSRGSSGKSVELVRATFDGYGFGFGRNFPPIDRPAELTYYFRVGSTTDEVLTAVGGNNAGHQVAWWVGVGGSVGNAIGTHSHTGGWNHVMDVVADTWYGVTLNIDPSTFTYDITVWEDGNPGNTATETGVAFRDGSAVEVIDQIQFGNFSDAVAGPAFSAFVDEVEFIGTRILKDGFESGNTGAWSSSTRPRTIITTCGQVVTTDAILNNDLSCPSGDFESAAIEVGASNITIDLGGHVITGHPIGIGVKVENAERVTVKNGTIRDFLVEMNIYSANTVTVKDLWMGNLVADDAEDFFPGLRVTQSQNVLVRDCFFGFLPVFHREAIVSAASEITLDNIEFKDGSIGVNIGGAGGTSGSVINSRFIDPVLGGVLVQETGNVRIAGNEFRRTCVAIVEHAPGEVTGVLIEHNSIVDWGEGVFFRAGSNSTIRYNLISGHDACGIALDVNTACPPTPTPACFYATGNVVANNTVVGNNWDLCHNPNATGNTWQDNICETTFGAEIPPCIPPGP